MELKPCPFCGGEAYIGQGDMRLGEYTAFVRCQKCFIRTQAYAKKFYAARIWNRRAKEEPCPKNSK